MVVEYAGPRPLLRPDVQRILKSLRESSTPKTGDLARGVSLSLAKQLVSMYRYISEENRYFVSDVHGGQFHWSPLHGVTDSSSSKHTGSSESVTAWRVMLVDVDHLLNTKEMRAIGKGYKGGDPCKVDKDCPGTGHSNMFYAPEAFGQCNVEGGYCEGGDFKTHVYALAVEQKLVNAPPNFQDFVEYVPELQPIMDEMLKPLKKDRPTFTEIAKRLSSIKP